MAKNIKIEIKEETIGQRIKAQRIRSRMTQEQLAEKMCVPKPTISSYENDRIDIKGSVIDELATMLNTDPNYLLRGAKQEDSDPYMNEMINLFGHLSDEKKEMALKVINALI